MYKQNLAKKSSLKVNKSTEGETIEEKVRRIVNNKEPIKDGAPLIYTDRKDGVLAGTNIRTDRFDVAIDTMDKVHKNTIAKREAKQKLGEQAKAGMDAESKTENKQNVGGTQSTDGTTK